MVFHSAARAISQESLFAEAIARVKQLAFLPKRLFGQGFLLLTLSRAFRGSK